MDKLELITFEELKEHVRIIDSNIKNLSNAIRMWVSGDLDEMNRLIDLIQKVESKASKVKNKLLIEISEAHASMNRGDLLRILLQLDKVGSYSDGAAVRLKFLSDIYVPAKDDPMIEWLNKLCDVFLKIGDKLKLVIKSLGGKIDKILNYCENIGEIENEVDFIYRSLEAHLYTRKDIDIRQIFQIRTVALHIEEACDIIEDLTDSIRILISTREF